MTRWRWDASIALGAAPRFRGGAKIPAAAAAHGSRGPGRGGVPRSACLPGEHRRRPRDSRPPAGQADHRRLPVRSDGHRGLREPAARDRGGGEWKSKRATWSNLRRSRSRSCRRGLTHSSTTRRWKSVAPRQWSAAAGSTRKAPPTSDGLTRRRLPASGKKPGRRPSRRTNCTMRSAGWVCSQRAKWRGKPEWAPLLDQAYRDKRITRVGPAGQPDSATLVVAAERLPNSTLCILTLLWCRQSLCQRSMRKPWSREEALVEIVRGRLEGLGPVTAASLAESIVVPVGDVDVALLALEGEGFVMRGSFTPGAETEWCERRLLARITRYTVKRLRQEIEPVSEADYMQFLFDWQHVGERMEGPDAVAAVVSQLEASKPPPVPWETELIPARVSGYEPHWLDDLCRAGRVVWTRLEAPKVDPSRTQGPSPVRRHAHHIADQKESSGVDGAGEDGRPADRARQHAGPGRSRISRAAWRFVLRRHSRRPGPAAYLHRGRIARTHCRRPDQLGWLSADCGRCCCRRIAANRLAVDAGVELRCLASKMPAAGP